MAVTTLVRARVKTERMKKVAQILDRMGLKPADELGPERAQLCNALFFILSIP